MDWSDKEPGQPQAPLTAPTPEQAAHTPLSGFIDFCAQRSGQRFGDYAAFERYAIAESKEFWTLLLEWSGVVCEGSRAPAIEGSQCESARFFPQLRLNYVENLLRLDGADFDGARPALTAVHADRPTERWTRAQLRAQVEALAAALAAQGLTAGNRVALVAHNTPGAVLGCLAAAALGCTVSSGAPDMGTPALLARFAQVEPVLLMADLPEVTPGSARQQRERLVELARALPSLRGVLLLDAGDAPAGLDLPVQRAAELLQRHAGESVAWPRLPFNHPLFVLFTSGTTGPPKCLVHGAGGTLLEHLKEHRLHCDLRPDDTLFFQTSTGWMMWNWQLSALASGVGLVLYDGPVAPVDRLWRIVAQENVSAFGTSPAYLQMCEAASLTPRTECDFASLRAVFATGSILYPRQQAWLWNCVKPLAVQSISGGTDIVGCFVLGNPNLPVWATLCQCRSLGLDVRAAGATAGQPGELVCANPFPSRPLGFLDDPDGARFHAAYFAANPGMWTHGDLVELTAHGARMHGRSDGVLNIRGIRIGPAEIYRMLADVPEITEAMAIERHADDEPGNARLVLLLVLRKGAALDAELSARIRKLLAQRGSPAHVPAAILAVDQLPTTHSGKRSERSARDALNGRAVVNSAALRNP
ncbi:MAG TPA: acetoacetate--CoA ligase, partial [Solimonas sp.]|nr:acetoacetate--CoA ligase [Solimonas sp.]